MSDNLPTGYDYGGHFPSIYGKHKVQAIRNYIHQRRDWWNAKYDEVPIEDIGGIICTEAGREKREFCLQRDDGVISFAVSDSYAEVTVYSDTISGTDRLMEEAKKVWPERKPVTSMMVPLDFWSYGNQGPDSVNREILGLKWDEIEGNYAHAVRGEIGDVVTNFKPSSSGQLILWTGPPGTGKTTALRSLAYEWRKWCKMHYITDVEKFFGTHADYMIKVLLSESASDKWKLLILEDAGEFLQPSARVETMGGSPALSRFLNTVDGLIGHGLKTLVLVTTNEPIKSLHKAVSRPGRCASDINFEGMTQEEALEWLRERGMSETDLPGETHLADLYATLNGVKSGTKDRSTPIGF